MFMSNENNMSMSKRLDIAIHAVKEAGNVTLNNFGAIRTINSKSFKDIVTNVDFEAEDIIIRKIKGNFPEDAIFSEEAGMIESKSDYLWIIDPLDGTNNYAIGFPYFSSSVAVQYKKDIVLAVVYNPVMDEMYYAEKNKGAYLNGTKIHVNGNKELSIGYYIQGYGVPQTMQMAVSDVLHKKTKRILNTWAPSLDWCNVARGNANFIIAANTETDDLVSGKLILEEAGGRVTDWNGDRLTLDLHIDRYTTVIASNGLSHEILLNVVKKANFHSYLNV